MLTFKTKHFNELSLIELYELMQLRQAVFVVEQDCPYLDADDKDQDCFHLLGYVGSDLAAYARLLNQGQSYTNYLSIGRIVTAQPHRRKGYGIELVRTAIKTCHNLFGNTPIKISAQQYLITFYESFGFQTIGEGYLEDGIPHIGMVLE